MLEDQELEYGEEACATPSLLPHANIMRKYKQYLTNVIDKRQVPTNVRKVFRADDMKMLENLGEEGLDFPRGCYYKFTVLARLKSCVMVNGTAPQ